ncbi:MAG TPA: type II toxin-antitoxin system VapC family toxin [Kiritimatiellia bacterium]|nr:type II toxin-antitoxin system VapC family toxin [Kiritimatiellia bacterium]
MTYCLDTNTCIYLLKGSFPHLSARFLALPPDRFALPAMVVAELYFGAEKSDRAKLVRARLADFLAPLNILPFDEKAAIRHAETRAALEKAGIPIGPEDLVIGATALAHGCALVTHNTREFGRIPGLLVEDWTHA